MRKIGFISIFIFFASFIKNDFVKIIYDFQISDNKVTFKLIDNNNSISDSLVIDDVIDIKQINISNSVEYYKIRRRCGTGCANETILMLENFNNIIVPTLNIYYTAKNVLDYENPYDFDSYKYVYKDYIIEFENSDYKLVIKTTKNNLKSYEIIELIKDKKSGVLFNNSKSINGTFDVYYENVKINLNGTYNIIELPDETLIYIDKKWYSIDFKVKILYKIY